MKSPAAPGRLVRTLSWLAAAALLLAGCATNGAPTPALTPTASPTPGATVSPSPTSAAASLTAAVTPSAAAAAATAPAGATAGGLALAPCQLASPGLPGRIAAQCGRLLVYEDPAAGAGRQIALRVAVLRAGSRDPAPDPLFFLAGGPGQAATEAYVPLDSAFAQINADHDIVLVDQRGTGGSNALRCPASGDTLEVDTLPEVTAASAACLPTLAGDPRFYTTSLAMDDLDQVRAALGYDQIDLYGVSYGTRAALTYLRQYPARVRAVILDGVVPQDEPLGLHAARDAQHALDLIFDRCADAPACAAAFPELPGDFARLSAALKQGPVAVRLNHPRTGAFMDLNFSYDLFANTVRFLSYSAETAALLPLLIHSAADSGDYRLLAADAIVFGDQLSESISLGMNAAVVCSEDAPFISAEQAAAANAGAYLGSSVSDQELALCAPWPAGVVPPGFKDPVSADTPVLLLSGGADPVTPPENAARAASTLPNSLSLIAPGQGHNVMARGCLPALAAQFIDAGSLVGLDTACVDQIAATPFFLSFTGMGP